MGPEISQGKTCRLEITSLVMDGKYRLPSNSFWYEKGCYGYVRAQVWAYVNIV